VLPAAAAASDDFTGVFAAFTADLGAGDFAAAFTGVAAAAAAAAAFTGVAAFAAAGAAAASAAYPGKS